MRIFASVLLLTALPVTAAAQHRFPLPSIGLPLPSIGLPPEPSTARPWDGRPHTPWWETRQLPPWEGGHVRRPVNVDVDRFGHRDADRFAPRRNNSRVVYVLQPYPIAVQQEPQIIVVQQPPVTRIVAVEVPVREALVEPAPRPAEPAAAPPYVPTGDRTLYVIPGCYVGNVPPQNVKLPANCDLTKVTTYVP